MAFIPRTHFSALLNTGHPDVDYSMSQASIISAVVEAIGKADLTDAGPLKDTLDTSTLYISNARAEC